MISIEEAQRAILECITPLEEEDGEWIRLTSTVKAGSHVRKKGEDIRNGNIVIPAGTLLRPQEIGAASDRHCHKITGRCAGDCRL